MKYPLLLIAFAACGPAASSDPRPGDPCDGGEPFTCFSGSTKGVCEQGRWLEYPCDGTFALFDGGTLVGECAASQPSRCMRVRPQVGDSCPVALEGAFSRCITPDTIGQCRGQRWVGCPTRPTGSRPGCEDFLLNGSEQDGVATSWTLTPDSGC